MPSCPDLSRLTDPAEICKFATENCSLNTLVPYASIVFCWMQSAQLRISVLVVSLIITSGAMGVAAFDYLSMNLTYIAEESGLPQALMGVTVLAFGNGSVDVFGAYVAMNAGEGGMALGEIMGGAIFVITVVAGSMAIIRPFKVDMNVITFDICVLAFATCYTLVIISDGVITLTEAFVGLFIYMAYALYVVHTQLAQSRAEHAAFPVEQPQFLYNDEEPIDGFTAVRPSLYSAVDLNWEVNRRLDEMDSQAVSPNSDHAVEHAFVGIIPRLIEPISPVRSPLQSTSGSTDRQPLPDTPESAERFSQRAPLTHHRRRSSAPEPLEPLVSPQPVLLSYNPFTLNTSSSNESSNRLPKLHTGLHSPFASQSQLTQPATALPSEVNRLLGSSMLRHSHTAHAQYSPYNMRQRRTHKRHHYIHNSPYSMKHLLGQLLDVHEFERHNTPTPERTSPEDTAEPENMNDDENNDDGDATRNVASPKVSTELSPSPNLVGYNDNLSAASIIPDEDEEELEKYMLYLWCPSLRHWETKTGVHRIVIVLMLPILTLLSWSVPLSVNAGMRNHIVLHSQVIPYVIPLVLPSFDYTLHSLIVQSVVAAFGFLYWGYFKRPLPSSLVVAGIGFFMGLLWVLFLATELVNILTILGEVCRVSNTVMGLTVFALGDSLGDFVSNITVAQIGFPTMAIAACFGGPIFTMLVGISGTSLLTMLLKRKSALSIPSPKGLKWSAGAIIAALVILLLQLRHNNNYITKQLGVQLIAFWFIYIAASICFF